MSKSSSNSSGIGFTGLLAVAFIVLKLCDIITWSWWWVLSPLWIGAFVGIIVVVCVIAMALIVEWDKP